MIAFLCLILGVMLDADRSFEAAKTRARELASQDFQAPVRELPEFLETLSYDDYRKIRFRNDRHVWRDESDVRFRLAWHHTGSLFLMPVTIHLVEGEEIHDVAYDPTTFDFGDLTPPALGPSVGLAGMSITYPLNRPDHFDEIMSFLGASYFRVVGAGEVYGLSARGLAIDTATESGEEFPRFSELWIEKPVPGASRIRVVALLESRRVTGAYRFSIEPGTETSIAVEAILFSRGEVAKLGVAPLASMFYFGENRDQWRADFRPEVHDSDGLLIASANGVTWRPLQNPTASHRVSRFPVRGPWGFGLLQRDRDPDHYCDLESRYHLRPSLWIEPERGFDGGAVELIEIPTPVEWNDNIVAYFVPEGGFGPGKPLELRYRLRAVDEAALFPGLLRAAATRIDPGDGKNPILFVVEFDSGSVPFAAEGDVRPSVTASRGEVRDLRLERTLRRDGWRVSFRLAADGSEPIVLELVLQHGERVVSERWSYTWVRP